MIFSDLAAARFFFAFILHDHTMADIGSASGFLFLFRGSPMYFFDRKQWPAMVVVCFLTLAIACSSRAAESVAPGTSLNKVPADAEAYAATLRLGETVSLISKTRVWQLIWNESAFQELWKKGREEYDAGKDGWDEFKKVLNDPLNKDLPSLITDAFSNEIFFYAGADWGDRLALMQQVYGSAYYGALLKAFAGANPQDSERAMVRSILITLSAKPDRLRIPDLVFGFKVSEPGKVAAQLKRLDPLLADALKNTPLKGRSKRVKVGGDDFLVLQIDGSLIPQAKPPLADFEDKPGEFGPLWAQMKKTKISFAVGIREGYLLVAIGESENLLKKFGGDGPKLSSRPEFKPLAKFGDRPITAISYTSASLKQAVSATSDDIKNLGVVAKQGLDKIELLKDERAALDKDIDELVKTLGNGLKKPGAELDFSLRTVTGWESYNYDYTEPSTAEQRPLTLLDHLGGKPLMAAVWRSHTTVEGYKEMLKWLTRFTKHGKAIIAAKAPNGEEAIDKYEKNYEPLVKEFSDVIEKLWLPALADGQEAFVIDAKWSSKQWHKAMPPTDKALPMFETGLILGVSDSVKLGQALEGFRAVANKTVAKLREEFPEEQHFDISKPQLEQHSGNSFARYPIPEEWGLDGQFLPTGGMSRKVAVVALSRGHAERLLDSTPLKINSLLLADTKRPLDSMFYLDWAGMVDVAAPWVTMAVEMQTNFDDGEKAQRIAGKVLQALKIFKGYAAVTYRENGATITHSEASFADIEPVSKK